MKDRLIIALDGHDGSGKTTLAKALGTRLGGLIVRPFSGANGRALMEAGEQRNAEKLVAIGSRAIEDALTSVPGKNPVVLDRGWMTVASFVPTSPVFFRKWTTWIPTTLCWADLPTTLSRLAGRHDEATESVEWHRHYLDVYMTLAQSYGIPQLRTDVMDIESCVEKLAAWAKAIPEPPFVTLR